MLSTLSADCLPGHPFPPFEPGFSPWENCDPPFLFHFEDEPAVFSPPLSQEAVTSNSGSDTLNPDPSLGSDVTNRNELRTLSSGSDETNCVLDDRKRRRMLSNRESARRSRKRKQKHLENLRNQSNRLKLGNRELTNRLRLIVYQTQQFHRENECLRTEAAVLRQRLWDIRQVLAVRQLLNPMPMPMQSLTTPLYNL